MLKCDNLDEVLATGGKIIIGLNQTDPSRLGPYESWLYDSDGDPLTFGLGESVADSLNALDDTYGYQIKRLT